MRPSSPAAPAPDLPVTLLTRDGAQINESWIDVGADAPIPDEGDIIVSAARLAEVGARRGRVAVRVQPTDKVEDLAPHLARVALVVVAFPKFRDGRGYTTARLLRERYGFAGDVRAEGDVLRDQLAFMIRCGFSSFAIRDRDAQAALAWARTRVQLAYQPAADGAPPIWRRRDARLRVAAE